MSYIPVSQNEHALIPLYPYLVFYYRCYRNEIEFCHLCVDAFLVVKPDVHQGRLRCFPSKIKNKSSK